MTWLQVILDTESTKVDEISDALMAIGSISITWLDAKDQPLYEPSLDTTPLWKHTRIIALFEDEIDIAQLQLLNLPAYQIQTLEDKEWVRVWMEDFQPMQFGEQVWICPSWQNPPIPEAIILDPGLAFGTGTHSTTALCLKWLDKQKNLANKTVIDYGCGSGILAITAAKLGAKHVWAVDNDPQALEATENNSKNNQVEKLITPILPDQLPTNIKVDYILANILAIPLINLAYSLTQHLNSKAKIILSGILQEQTTSIITAYQSHCEIEETKEQDGWMLIVGKKVNQFKL
ncbi:MAG TPA: 50S ribosomal protein L11 methyltransferase [Thioploca sp.]|nr:50S ribosomal protein L11 methyltransferase [Thioploca sp.]